MLEAMALAAGHRDRLGRPLDYLDADCGILVPPVSADGLVAGLTAAMLEMAISPERRRRMGECALAKVRSHYSWDGKVGRMIEFYDAARRSALRRSARAGPSRLMRILILSDVSGFMPGGVPLKREIDRWAGSPWPRVGLRRRHSRHECATGASFPDHGSDRPLFQPASRRDA